MKEEYDFTLAERGKFYHPEAVLSLPVYLDADVHEFLSRLADRKQIEVQDLVNALLRADITLLQSMQ